ncbi:MAG: hypothetical protein K2O94_00905 [Clostridiales bacterium]|nr:hypothetical protein [Clostridiales bacterium]
METTILSREAFAADFEQALRIAGMQSGEWGFESDKPKYWRGQVKETEKALYLLYSVMDSPEVQAADNRPHLRIVYAYGTIFSRNGYSDAEYQTLIANIQAACAQKVPKITILLGGEGNDTSIDPDSSIAYINFTAYQKIIL